MEPQQISEVPEDSSLFPPSLSRLIEAYGAQTEFDHLLLAFHCLMVEAGFAAVVGNPKEAVSSAAPRPPDFALPSCVGDKLPRASSASILYVARASGFALLKVINAGTLAVCHCGVATSVNGQPAAAASAYFPIRRHVNVGTCGPESIKMSGMAELARKFKDSIAEAAKSSLAYECGLPPPGLPSLPTELLHHILRYCDFRSVCRLGQMNRQMLAVSFDNVVWRDQMRMGFSHTFQYERAHAAELQSQSVDFREVFKTGHVERSRVSQALARRGSLELMPSPMVSPQQLEAQRTMRTQGFVMFRGVDENGARRRHSVSLLPFEQSQQQLLERGSGVGELFLVLPDGGRQLWSNVGHFPPPPPPPLPPQ